MNGRDDTPDVYQALCRRLKSSDRAAFKRVFQMLREDLLRYVRSLVHREAVVHDLVQDVFIALWEARETLDPSLPLKAYVYRMARNAAYRHLRDTRTHLRKHEQIKRERNGLDASMEVRDSSLDATMLANKMREWIAVLPDRQREALVLSRFHQLSHREIASVMDISPRTVNNHIVRALGSLQEKMEQFEPALLES